MAAGTTSTGGTPGLPPVVYSTGQVLVLRFQSVNFAPNAGRGVTAVVTYVSAPRPQAPAAPVAAAPAGPLPLACVSVGLGMQPWVPAANPQYPASPFTPSCAQPPATVDVSSLRGRALTLGYQAAGTTVGLRDTVAFNAALAACTPNCSAQDSPVSAYSVRPALTRTASFYHPQPTSLTFGFLPPAPTPLICSP